MTTGCNIFRDKTAMPSREQTEIDTPVRVRQSTESAKGAQVTYPTGPRDMNVANVMRPRRGHDY